jgi:hypothetical protein
MKWEKADRSTPAILAIEAVETLRANNQLCDAQSSMIGHRGHDL